MLIATMILMLMGYVTVRDLNNPLLGYTMLFASSLSLIGATGKVGRREFAILFGVTALVAIAIFLAGWPLMSLYVLSLGVVPWGFHSVRAYRAKR